MGTVAFRLEAIATREAWVLLGLHFRPGASIGGAGPVGVRICFSRVPPTLFLDVETQRNCRVLCSVNDYYKDATSNKGIATRSDRTLRTGLLALLLGARTLLVTSASLLVTSALLVVTRTLLGAPGLTARNKKLLGASASLLVTSATLVVTSALLVVTRSKND